MDERVLITEARSLLSQAETGWNSDNREEYNSKMQAVLELLTKELVGDAPAEPGAAPSEE